MDGNYGLSAIRAGLQAAIDEGFIERQPVAPLAHILLGALDEAAMLGKQKDTRGLFINRA